MKRIFYLILLVCLSIPIYLFSQSSPDRSSQTLQFCLENLSVMDSLMIEVNRLDKFIEIYETELDRDRETWFETLQWISRMALPSRTFMDQWQEERIPDRQLVPIQLAKLDFTYELIKLSMIRERLEPMIVSQYKYWQHIDEIEVLIDGLKYQIQVLVMREEVLKERLKVQAEQAHDILMRKRAIGEVWIAMKEDMKATYDLLEKARTSRSEDAEMLEKMYLDLRVQLVKHLTAHSRNSKIEEWPSEVGDHIEDYYQTIGFEILPRVKQIISAHESRYHTFFASRFEGQLEELATHFVQIQDHVRQLANYPEENLDSILSSAP